MRIQFSPSIEFSQRFVRNIHNDSGVLGEAVTVNHHYDYILEKMEFVVGDEERIRTELISRAQYASQEGAMLSEVTIYLYGTQDDATDAEIIVPVQEHQLQSCASLCVSLMLMFHRMGFADGRFLKNLEQLGFVCDGTSTDAGRTWHTFQLKK